MIRIVKKSTQMDIRDRNLQDEFVFHATRSSGPGGQNVNKVSSKVELRFNIDSSVWLNEEEKAMIAVRLINKINNAGELILVSQSDRSQLKNREKVIEKFYVLVNKALTPPKPRLKTMPTSSSVEKRLESKRFQATIKAKRKGVDFNSDPI